MCTASCSSKLATSATQIGEMKHRIPKNLLIVRPDAYGDLVLFEPALRLLRQAWPDTDIAVLIRERYRDITPLIAPGIRWLSTQCDPYGQGVAGDREAFEALRQTVAGFAPDCVVAACFDKTWIEAAVASFVPEARRVSLGRYRLDPISKIILQDRLLMDTAEAYPETVMVGDDALDLDKNLQLAAHLLGREVPQLMPGVELPDAVRKQARVLLSEASLKEEAFVACCPAGTVKVAIKAWPAEKFGEVVRWLHETHGLRTLLLGHETESTILDEVRQAVRDDRAAPAIWTGKDGQIALLGAFLKSSRLYLGNDTGAMHLAAALGKPVVSIFGGGTWPRFKPVARRAISIVQPLPCFGCRWECHFGDAPCLKRIEVDVVKRALERMLNSETEFSEEMVAKGSLTTAEHELISHTAQVARSFGQLKVVGADGHFEWLQRADLHRLINHLEGSEADRAARLDIIHRQGEELGKMQQASNQWAEQSQQLLTRVSQIDQERTQLLGKLEKLVNDLAASEADRVTQSATSQSFRERFAAAENESTSLMAELETVRRQFVKAEADRAAQLVASESVRDQLATVEDESKNLGTQLEVLRGQLITSEADRAVQLAAGNALRERLDTVENERNSLKGQLEDVRGQFVLSEADRAARLSVIERQGAELCRLYGELRTWFQEVRTISVKAYEAESEARRWRTESNSLGERLERLQQEHQRVTGQFAEQGKALEESLRSVEAARARVKELQDGLSRIEEHWLIRLLRSCGLWRR